jgi:hypothetical protein
MTQTTTAQDDFAQLNEECRLGWVYRCVIHSNPNRTSYHQHQPGVDMNIPVFWLGEMPAQLIGGADSPLYGAMTAIKENRFKLPYPRSAYMYALSSDNPAMHRLPVSLHNDTPRHYVMVAEQSEDNSILLFCFMHHATEPHWARQTWQVFITQSEDGAIETAFDPESKVDPVFMAYLSQSVDLRVQQWCADVYRLMTANNGVVGYADGGSGTDRINARRDKLHLPTVPRLRIIDFNAPPPATVVGKGTGTPKSPHFRRGGWRTLATGRQTWIPASAIKGGGGEPPPWYEVR